MPTLVELDESLEEEREKNKVLRKENEQLYKIIFLLKKEKENWREKALDAEGRIANALL